MIKLEGLAEYQSKYEKDIMWLKQYAISNKIDELNSEDLMKLFEKGYIIEDIKEAFGISTKEFEQIRKHHKLNNIYLESIIRNIDAILHYIDNQGRYISNKIIKQISLLLIKELSNNYPKSDYYYQKLLEIEFNRSYIYDDIIKRNIDVDYRVKQNQSIIKKVDKILELYLNEEKILLLNYNNNKLYNKLNTEKTNGKILTTEDLTYDVMFELSIIENIPDSLIGELFDLKKHQIRYLRQKMNLVNALKIKLSYYPEVIPYLMEDGKKLDKSLTNIELDKYMKKSLDYYLGISGHEEELTSYTKGNKININGTIYTINVSNSPYKITQNKRKKKNNGARRNRKQENDIKLLHGRIGENIVKEYEKQRLIAAGLKELANEINLITQINESVTFDGLGYDLISYNELGEKICIEVKTSYGRKDKPFFISKKELEMLRGYSKEFDCQHSFIYYVLIEDRDVNIKIIDCNTLDKVKLEPILYKVIES